MGDPKKQRKKFAKPTHPWQKSRLDDEAEIIKEYCLKNKKELWKMLSKLKHYKSRAKLVTAGTEEAAGERALLLNSLKSLHLIQADAQLDDVLGLQLNGILERRLQSIVYRKGLAKSMRQARQFIVHKHIKVGNKVMAVPSYIVSGAEEEKISFVPRSALGNPSHPERVVEEKPKKTKK